MNGLPLFNQPDPEYGLSFERIWNDPIQMTGLQFLEEFYFDGGSEEEQQAFLEEEFPILSETEYEINDLVINFSQDDIDTFDDHSVYAGFEEENPEEFEQGAYIAVYHTPQPVALRISGKEYEVDSDTQYNFVQSHYAGQGEMLATERFLTPLQVIKEYGYSERLLELAEMQGQLQEAREALSARGVKL